jgi:RNA polymerase sigma factor (sigma-70 family)
MSLSRSELDAMYRAHGHLVLRRAKRLLQNDDDARDVVQDVFLELHRNAERFAGKSSITTYLYAMTTHACLNRLRNARTRARLLALHGRGPTTIPARGEGRALAFEVLTALPPDDAELAIYLHCDELTHEEIAELRGCSRRHVTDLAARLQRRLEERFAS